MIRQWKVALILGWSGIAALVALALVIGLVLGLAIAGDPAQLNHP